MAYQGVSVVPGLWSWAGRSKVGRKSENSFLTQLPKTGHMAKGRDGAGNLLSVLESRWLGVRLCKPAGLFQPHGLYMAMEFSRPE